MKRVIETKCVQNLPSYRSEKLWRALIGCLGSSILRLEIPQVPTFFLAFGDSTRSEAVAAYPVTKDFP